MAQVNVLLFHRISESAEGVSEITPAIFRRCLDVVQEAGLAAITVSGCCDRERFGNALGAVSLTFDDGWESDAGVVLPELVRRGLRATFFIITEKMGSVHFLSWFQVRELAEAGMEVGSHSRSHADLTRLQDEDLRTELRSSRQELEDRTGRRVSSLSVPHGHYNRRVLAAAQEAGYTSFCVSRPGLNRLPLRPGAPIRRNAVHRLVPAEAIPRLVRPTGQTLLRWEAGYAARLLLKGILRGERYTAFRRWALARSRKGREIFDG